jgi:hypothetical protein
MMINGAVVANAASMSQPEEMATSARVPTAPAMIIHRAAAAALTYGVVINRSIMRRRWLLLFYCEHRRKVRGRPGSLMEGSPTLLAAQTSQVTSDPTWH